MFFAEGSVDSVANLIAALVSGGTITAIFVGIVKYMGAKDKARTVATSDENKRERAKLDLDIKRMEIRERQAETADEKNQRAYDDLYTKHLQSQKRMDEMQEHITRCEVERAVALTQAAENKKRIEELQASNDRLHERLALLESRGG